MKYLIFGHGGYKNKGCEALILTCIKQIIDYDNKAYITVADFDYDNDISLHIDIVDKYVRHSIKSCLNEEQNIQVNNYISQIEKEKIFQSEVLKEIDDSDYCISIGGDNYSEGFVPYLYVISHRAKELNKKLIMWGCSVMENITDINLINDFRQFDIIIARESITYNALKGIIDNKKLFLIPDSAFGLEKQKFNMPFKFKKYIIINLSDIIIRLNNNSINIICNMIEYILDKYGYNIVLLPHVYSSVWDDSKTLKKIKDRFNNDNRVFLLDDREYSCKELKYVISNAKFAIISRTHASIAAYSTCVPTLVIGYSVKSKGIAQDLFSNYVDYVIPSDKLNLNLLIEKFDFLVKNEEDIKESLSNLMNNYICESNKSLKLAVESINQNDCCTITKNECCGCTACYNACPVEAINMIPDEEGFIKPVINLDKCIKCGKCKKVCPLNNLKKEVNEQNKAYVAKNNDIKTNMKSSSGGIFSILANYILTKNGVVYGATLENNAVNHIRISKKEELDKILGSKYVQSNLYNIFKLIKLDLESNIDVLFCGTPCQVAGLHYFLGKNYDNLLKISFVCHGVPNQALFKDYLKTLETEKSKVLSVNFRDKTYGWKDFGLKYTFDNKIIINNHEEDPFMRGFLDNLYLRKSCYECNFKINKNNCSDIVLGDLWGNEVIAPKIESFDGISMICACTSKGRNIIDVIRKECFLKKLNLDEICKFNACLYKNVDLNKFRYEFFKNYNGKNLKELVQYYNVLNSYENLNKQLKDSIEQLNSVTNSYNSIKYYYDKIAYSKRWIYSSKMVNLAKKILRRGNNEK